MSSDPTSASPFSFWNLRNWMLPSQHPVLTSDEVQHQCCSKESCTWSGLKMTTIFHWAAPSKKYSTLKMAPKFKGRIFDILACPWTQLRHRKGLMNVKVYQYTCFYFFHLKFTLLSSSKQVFLILHALSLHLPAGRMGAVLWKREWMKLKATSDLLRRAKFIHLH